MRLIKNYWSYISNFISKFNYQIPISIGLLLVYKDYELIYKNTNKYTNNYTNK